jgi:hypothetical protein
MNKALAGLVAAAGVALVVTAAGLHPKVGNVVTSLANGGAKLEEASLGERVA